MPRKKTKIMEVTVAAVDGDVDMELGYEDECHFEIIVADEINVVRIYYNVEWIVLTLVLTSLPIMKQSFSLVSSKQCDYSIIMLLSGTFLTAGAKSRKTFSFLKEPFINSTCGQCLQSVFAQSIQERNIGKLQINIGLRSESIIIM